jgi:hypothetical protein
MSKTKLQYQNQCQNQYHRNQNHIKTKIRNQNHVKTKIQNQFWFWCMPKLDQVLKHLTIGGKTMSAYDYVVRSETEFFRVNVYNSFVFISDV